MRSQSASRTADLVAAARAGHTRYDSPVVLNDPIAYVLLDEPLRSIVGNRWTYAVIGRGLFRPLRPLTALIVARARYFEDQIAPKAESGPCTVLILGAGLDSLSYRHPEYQGSLTITEIDHPASQAAKRERLERINRTPVHPVRYVPANFDTQPLTEILTNASLPEEPTMVSWLGVTYYLDRESVVSALKDMAEILPIGSEVILDYSTPKQQVSRGRVGRKMITLMTDSFGEPLKTRFTPEEIRSEAVELGYEVVRDLSGNELTVRYFADQANGLRVPPSTHIVHLRVTV